MLTKITLNNFKSFKNAVTIDLTKTNYTILPQNVADNGILKGCIFVGANASGKSTVLMSIKLLLDLLFKDQTINLGRYLCLFNHKPSYSISYEFLIDSHIVQYELSVDIKKAIIIEKLSVDDIQLLERMGQSACSYIADKSGVRYNESDVGKGTLFLRTLYFNTKFASNPVLVEWMTYLQKSVYVHLFDKRMISYGQNDVSLIPYLENDGCRAINDFFHEYNFEQHIEYEHSSKGGHVQLTVGENDTEKTVFFKRKGIEVPIVFSDESLGNQNLIHLLPAFLSVIESGGLLLIDEFSSGFHNDLESLLVRYFMEKATHAQLLFVSHSTNLLSNSILRPDQEYAVEFHGAEGSSVKRFSTEQPRSAQNIEKMYVSGVFGGLPDYVEVDDEAE